VEKSVGENRCSAHALASIVRADPCNISSLYVATTGASAEMNTKLHPIINKWILRHEEQRRAALASDSAWVREHAPPPLLTNDRRLHRVANQLLRVLEEREAEISEQENGDLRATIAGESLDFRIRERKMQTREWSKDRRSVERKLVGTGKLVVALQTYLRPKHNEEWRENDANPMEDQIPKIVDRLFEGAQILKAWRQEIENEQHRREQAAAERTEKERLAKLDRNRREKFVQSAVDWRLANEVRKFIAVLRSQPLNGDEEIKGKTLEEWLNWADGIADAIDPLGDGTANLFNSIGSES
jgi:hypothetical protein